MKHKKVYIFVIIIIFLSVCILLLYSNSMTKNEKQKQVKYVQYIETKIQEEIIYITDSNVTVKIDYISSEDCYSTQVAIETKEDQILTDDQISMIKDMIAKALDKISLEDITIIVNNNKYS